MTFGFLYLLVLLAGLTLVLVGGLGRRITHPSELCDRVALPSHDHRVVLHTSAADFVVSFIFLSGLSTFSLHGLTDWNPPRVGGGGHPMRRVTGDWQ